MIGISDSERRLAFSVWLRTGRPPNVRADGVELKFNPYHDPRNGQFTFGPGGPRFLDRVVVSHPRQSRATDEPDKPVRRPGAGRSTDAHKSPSRTIRGFLARRADDLMTLEQAIPTLNEAIGGATFVIPEKVFEHGRQLVEDAARQADRIVRQIRVFVPGSVLDQMDPRPFIEDARERLQDVRLVRAAASMRFENDFRRIQLSIRPEK